MINIDELVVAKTIDKYGPDRQLIVAIEEMSELQKELCKSFRVNRLDDLTGNRRDVVEELADVLIMLDDVKQIFDIKDEELNEIVKKKQDRIVFRMRQA